MNYLKKRLKEKSTRVAFIGLATVLLYHVPNIPADVVNALSLLAIALFVGAGASKG
jgi:hypothetical protein